MNNLNDSEEISNRVERDSVLILFSGGWRSVYNLIYFLSLPRKKIHVHYINIIYSHTNSKLNKESELKLNKVKQLINYIQCNFKRFKFTITDYQVVHPNYDVSGVIYFNMSQLVRLGIDRKKGYQEVAIGDPELKMSQSGMELYRCSLGRYNFKTHPKIVFPSDGYAIVLLKLKIPKSIRKLVVI